MPRQRSMQVVPSDTRTYLTGFRNPDGSWASVSSYTQLMNEDVMWMEDNPTVDFRRRRNNGEIIFNPMKSTRYKLQAEADTIKVRRLSDGRVYEHQGATPIVRGFATHDAIEALAADMRTRAATAARARVASPDVAGIVSYLERAETLALLAEPFRLLTYRTEPLRRLIVREMDADARKRRRAISTLEKAVRRDGSQKRFRQGPPPRIVSLIADWWMKYRFGILPLMSDVEGVLEALSKPSGRMRETARALEQDSRTFSGSHHGFNATWGNSETRSHQEVWDVEVRAGVLYDFESTLSSRLGLTPGAALGSIYDAITLSFVADWFLNVGNVLDAITADLRGDILSQWVTTTITCNRVASLTSTWQPVSTATEPIHLPKGVPASELLIWRTRAPFNVGDVGFSLKPRMSAARYADAAALIWGRFTGNLRERNLRL